MQCGGCGLLIDFSQVPPGVVVACPRCGAQYRNPDPLAPPTAELPRTSIVSGIKKPTKASHGTPVWGLIGFVVFMAIALSLASRSPSDPTKPRQVVENSEWDASVHQVVSYLNSSLRDPDSYQSIEWSPVKKTDTGFIVRHKYRAKNGFGGYVVNDQVFLLDARGMVLGAMDRE